MIAESHAIATYAMHNINDVVLCLRLSRTNSSLLALKKYNDTKKKQIKTARNTVVAES